MNNIKKVIILGAGASKSDGAPLQRDLFKDFFEYIYENKINNNLIEKQEKILINFFKIFWKIDIQNQNTDEFPTFEECLSILDLAYIRGESFRRYNPKKIDETRNALIYLIGKVLDNKLQWSNNYHEKLVIRLEEERSLLETAFISLNYDIIIDNVLLKLYDNEDRLYLDYGINFINPNWEKPISEKSIPLYKIHGSLNWLYCSTCNQMEYTYNKKIKSYTSVYKKVPCRECKTSMGPVIIPPTFYKNLNNPFIQQIFLKSEKVLRNADEIFVCGYSFPDSDIFIKYILKRAELFNQNSPKIHIINQNPEKEYNEEEKKHENSRINRTFKNKANINFTDLSFQEFCENGL